MKWEGPYRIKCPKCGCRKIWVTEVTEGGSLHLIDNGVWDHFWDDNEYGMIVRTECKCDNCGHHWNKREATIDSFLKDDD